MKKRAVYTAVAMIAACITCCLAFSDVNKFVAVGIVVPFIFITYGFGISAIVPGPSLMEKISKGLNNLDD